MADNDDLTFTVEVDWTDRTRTGLAFTTFTKTVTVLASTDTEATRVAAQMVAGTIGQDDMVIATRVIRTVA